MTSERIKEIQLATGYPHSVSVQQALLQVWNECAQEKKEFGTLNLKVEYKDHDKVVLTNSSGDTYTSKSEELMDFLHTPKEKNTTPKFKVGDEVISTC